MPGWSMQRTEILQFTCAGLAAAGAISCPGAKVGDKVVDAVALGTPDGDFTVIGLLTGQGDLSFGSDQVERTVTVADQVQQIAGDWSIYSLIITLQRTLATTT